MIPGRATHTALAALGIGSAAGTAAKKLATGGYGAGAAGMLYGGMAGGAWGAVSDDTSVVGGMMGGALMGGGAGRYGGAGLARFRAATARGIDTMGAARFAARGTGRKAMRDVGNIAARTRRLIGNTLSRPANPVASTMKGPGAAAAAPVTLTPAMKKGPPPMPTTLTPAMRKDSLQNLARREMAGPAVTPRARPQAIRETGGFWDRLVQQKQAESVDVASAMRAGGFI